MPRLALNVTDFLTLINDFKETFNGYLVLNTAAKLLD